MNRRELLKRGGAAALLLGTAGGLAACGSGASESGVTEIEYWHINGESFGLDALRRLVSTFNRENPDVSVTERFQQGSYSGLLENIQTAQAAGTPPDIATVGYDSLGYVATNFDVTPADEVVTDEAYLDAWPESIRSLGQVSGEQVGIPYALSIPVTYFNADMMREAGLDPREAPTTWEGWAEVAATVRDELDKPALCIAVAPGITGYAQAMIESNGGEVLACDGGESAVGFDGPEAIEATAFWGDLVADGQALNVLGDQTAQAFLSGEVAVLFGVTSSVASFRDQASFSLEGTTFPTFEGNRLSIPGGGNNLLIFSEDDSKREAAGRFVRFLTSAEGIQAWCDATGYSPVRDDVRVGDDPILSLASEQVDDLVPWVSFPGPNAFQASQTFFDAHQRAVTSRDDVRATMDRAAQEVAGLIEGQPCA